MTDGYDFLRLLHHRYSEMEYLNESWILVKEGTLHYLETPTNSLTKCSEDSIYCQIYKSTCRGYKERLFNDLKQTISDYVQEMKIQLDEYLRKVYDDRTTPDMSNYLLKFSDYLESYRKSIERLVPIFHYLETVYLIPTLRTTIRQQLLMIFKSNLIENHVKSIFHVLRQLISSSEGPNKEATKSLLNLIDEMSPEFSVTRDGFLHRYCNGEDILNEMTNNDEETIFISAPRTCSKRSVDNLPEDGDQPLAKRTTNLLKSSESDDRN